MSICHTFKKFHLFSYEVWSTELTSLNILSDAKSSVKSTPNALAILSIVEYEKDQFSSFRFLNIGIDPY